MEVQGDQPLHRVDFCHLVCMRCRPTGPCRFGVTVRRAAAGHGVVGLVRFSAEHEGTGGVVHGGSVMGALDDACGAVPLVVDVFAVTAEMNVVLHRPVPLERDLEVRAWPESRDDRGNWMIAAEMTLPGETGALCGAHARFVERDPVRHFGRHRAWLAQGEIQAS